MCPHSVPNKAFEALSQWKAEAAPGYSRDKSELQLLNLFVYLSLARSKTGLMETFSSLGFGWVYLKIDESIALGVEFVLGSSCLRFFNYMCWKLAFPSNCGHLVDFSKENYILYYKRLARTVLIVKNYSHCVIGPD